MLRTSAMHCLMEFFLKRSLEDEIKPYTLNSESWVSNYGTATYFLSALNVDC